VTAPLVEHIGILVRNLEEAIERWTAVTGYRFSPIARYRTSRYRERVDNELHELDARISFSLQGPPRIELVEVTGSGTHGPTQLGVHHLGFMGVADPEGRMAQLQQLGIADDGISLDEEGHVLLFLTDKQALDGVRLELISPRPGPVVADDGSALPRDPKTGRVDLWAPVRDQFD
jgi:catechol 2,3-dioxygenase-like lactoylglutathione lyase family enzyme